MDELSHRPKAAAGDGHRQVVGPGHQVEALHLFILIDALGDAVKAVAPLGRDAHLDQRRHQLVVGLGPVDQRRIAQYDVVPLVLGDLVGNALLVPAQHRSKLRRRQSRVLLQQRQKFSVHTRHQPFSPERTIRPK